MWAWGCERACCAHRCRGSSGGCWGRALRLLRRAPRPRIPPQPWPAGYSDNPCPGSSCISRRMDDRVPLAHQATHRASLLHRPVGVESSPVLTLPRGGAPVRRWVPGSACRTRAGFHGGHNGDRCRAERRHRPSGFPGNLSVFFPARRSFPRGPLCATNTFFFQ